MEHNEKLYMVKIRTIQNTFVPIFAQHVLYDMDDALELGVQQAKIGNDIQIVHFKQDAIVASIGGVYRDELPCQGKPVAPLYCEGDPNDAAA